MSHFRECMVELKALDEEVAKEAMAELASHLGDSVTTVVADYFGRPARVVAGLERLGYGVTVSDGGVKVLGDPYGKKVSIEEFRDRFVQMYTVAAMRRVLRKAGFNVSKTISGKNIVLTGVRV